MVANSIARRKIDSEEVGEVYWFTAKAALKRLDHPLERSLLEASLQEPSVRTLSANSNRKGWRRFVRPISLERLESTLGIVEGELDFVIEQANGASGVSVSGWDQRAKQLLRAARQAVNVGDAELGWRYLKAAERFMLYGLNSDQLLMEAKPLLAEANDEGKELSKWRKTSIQELLCGEDGELKTSPVATDVVRAKRIIDEHHDNVYQKIAILRNRLLLLTIASFVTLVTWLISPPFSPYPSALVTATADSGAGNWLSPRLAWFGVILSGVLGALFSGFSSSISSDRNKAPIPSELSSSTVTFARLSMAVVASLAASILLASGVLNLPTPSYELMLAVAFAAGFSDRLLLRGLESLSR